MKNYRISAPPRLAAVGFGPGAGGSRLPAYQGSPWFAMGGPSSSSSNPLADAFASFQASALSSAQVALGALLVATALLILISQTSAAAAAGSVGKGAARRGLRAIPVVGALA